MTEDAAVTPDISEGNPEGTHHPEYHGDRVIQATARGRTVAVVGVAGTEGHHDVLSSRPLVAAFFHTTPVLQPTTASHRACVVLNCN